MPVTTPIRLTVLFMLIAIAGFFAAGATDGSTVPVAIGFLGLFAAGAALAAETDAESGTNRPASRRRHRPARIDAYAPRTPLATWEPQS